MNRLTLRAAVALLAFVIGIVASTVWVVNRFSSAQKPTAETNAPAEVPTVAFCDLLVDPARYSRKVVRTQAVLIADSYVRSLSDADSCLTKEPMVGFELDPSFQDELDDEVRKRLYNIVRGDGEHHAERARVTVVGWFEGPLLPEGQTLPKGTPAGKYEYQHRFIIVRIEKMETIASESAP